MSGEGEAERKRRVDAGLDLITHEIMTWARIMSQTLT